MRTAVSYDRQSTPNAPIIVNSLPTTLSLMKSGTGLGPFVPASTMRPPRRARSIACVTASTAYAVTSTTTSAICPPVISRTRAVGCSRSMSIVWCAPNSRASASFRSSRERPVTIMHPAPASRAAITLASPRWPGPRITIVSPTAVRGRSTAQRKPAPIGLKSTASSAGTSFDILCTRQCAPMYRYSA